MTRYALELMARQQKRTVSSYLEQLTETAVEQETLTLHREIKDDEDWETAEEFETLPMMQALDVLWHPSEVHRFVLLAFRFPEVLSFEEKMMWQFVKKASYYWLHFNVEGFDEDNKPLGTMRNRMFEYDGANWQRLEEHWELLQAGDFGAIEKQVQSKGLSLEDCEIVDRPANEPAEVTVVRFPAKRIEGLMATARREDNG